MQFGIDPQTLFFSIVTILIGLSIHEAMHAYVGLKLGDTTAADEGRVSFNPLRHIDPFTTVLLPLITLIIFQFPVLAARPVPFNPDRVKFDEFGAAMIAAAGPLSNLVLAFIGAIGMQMVTENTVLLQALSIFTVINIGLFVFNLIPIPPLDGSRVLYAFAPEPLQRFMASIEPYGIFVVFGLVLAVPGFSAFLVDVNSSVLRALLSI